MERTLTAAVSTREPEPEFSTAGKQSSRDGQLNRARNVGAGPIENSPKIHEESPLTPGAIQEDTESQGKEKFSSRPHHAPARLMDREPACPQQAVPSGGRMLKPSQSDDVETVKLQVPSVTQSVQPAPENPHMPPKDWPTENPQISAHSLGRSFLPTRAPSLLQPRTLIAPRTALGVVPERSVTARSSGLPEAVPTIHVSIGRIEVRAISSAPPPKIKKTPATFPRLNDYLAQRNEGKA